MNQSGTNDISVEAIDERSTYLSEIKKLWRTHSITLGFFPDGAFDEHAKKGMILVAMSPDKDFMGYLLYRSVRRGAGWPIAVVVHLCVSSKYRKKGVAKVLVEGLCGLTRDTYLRLELKCRRDFDANRMWPNVGFTYQGEQIGRAGFSVVRWHMAFRDLPLMAILQQNSQHKRFLTVIDSNIFYRLQDSTPLEPRHEKYLYEEAKALLEEWVNDDVTVAITDETLNEIERNDNDHERQRRLTFAGTLNKIQAPQQSVVIVRERLGSFFSGNLTDNLKSDIMQISQAIAGHAYCFITQDKGILRKADDVEEQFGIKIMTPGEFVGHLDEVIRDVQYRPTALGGSRRLIKSMLHGRINPELHAQFRDSDASEKKGLFDGQLRVFMAQPSRYKIELCSQSNEEYLALIVLDRGHPSILTVPMLRIVTSPLGETVLRYMLRQIVMTAFHEKRVTTQITDASCADRFGEAFEELGFTRLGDDWLKCSLTFIGNSMDLQNQLKAQSSMHGTIGEVFQSLSGALGKAIETRDAIALVDVERRLWPTKILDANIGNYVIPIKPAWAQHLFDDTLAAQTLWGANEDVSLRHENVYYRRYTAPSQVKSPARILWYVTKDVRYAGSMHLKACSFLDEVIIAKAKDLFKRFHRLGIYEWKDILKTCGDNPDDHLMALRFSNTEIFKRPISLQYFTEIVKREDGKSPFLRSPQVISTRAFSVIYSYGMELS